MKPLFIDIFWLLMAALVLILCTAVWGLACLGAANLWEAV